MEEMFLRSLHLKNLLSFKDMALDLRPLNVIIGPNASGKSNLIDAIGLLRAAPTDLAAAIRLGGPVSEWIWKRAQGEDVVIGASVTLQRKLQYRLKFGAAAGAFEVIEEGLEPGDESPEGDPLAFFSRGGKHLTVAEPISGQTGRTDREQTLDSASQSALKFLNSPLIYPEAASVGAAFTSIRIYRGWDTSPISVMRRGVPANVVGDELVHDGSNVALVLNQIEATPERERIEHYLRQVVDGFEQLFTTVREGAVVLRVKERGLGLTPAARLSDGTLRFLCLMTALFHPEPPPLICIEEPEIGLHPDALQLVAEALREAAEHTQIIVTTHSEALVDALGQGPEAVIVFEKDFDNRTQLRRLETKKLEKWLERYRLGELWRRGEIGGNRW